jgi:cholesterol transport system auxiliary component
MIAVLSAGLMLGGCVTLFPKSNPAQLYRFGEADAALVTQAPAAARTLGVRLSTSVTQEAGGDRILTAAGAESAYVAQARWVTPAAVLFDEAATRAFEGPKSPFKVFRRSDPGMSALTLRLDVESFEADYPPGWKGAPTVLVRVRATLIKPGAPAAPAEQMFEVREPAAESRMGAIVAAFDAATANVLDQTVTWAAAQAGT